MQMRLVALLACVAFMAGCTSPTTDDPDVQPPAVAADASSYTIALSDFPTGSIAAGQGFHFNSTISGAAQRTTDHIGAHFGANSTGQPSTTVYSGACAHQGGALPGRYEVTCTAPTAAGVYYLRGHARMIENNVTTNWWSTETTFTVA